MPRDASKRVDVRLGARNLSQLSNIKTVGDFGDDSTAVRFCISFTHTMFRILPATLVESYVDEQGKE